MLVFDAFEIFGFGQRVSIGCGVNEDDSISGDGVYVNLDHSGRYPIFPEHIDRPMSLKLSVEPLNYLFLMGRGEKLEVDVPKVLLHL